MQESKLKSATEIATHSDGIPFRTPVSSPPAPGGTWPGQRTEANKPKGPVADLVRETLDDQNKRRFAAQNILDSGFLGDTMWSAEAFKIVEAAWEDVQGNTLASETRRWLAEQRKRIAAHNKTYRDDVEAAAALELSSRRHKNRTNAAAALTDASTALSEADAVIASAVADVESQLGEQNIAGTVLRAGWRLAGAREVAAILRKTIIPSREKQLAKLDAEIAANA